MDQVYLADVVDLLHPVEVVAEVVVPVYPAEVAVVVVVE